MASMCGDEKQWRERAFHWLVTDGRVVRTGVVRGNSMEGRVSGGFAWVEKRRDETECKGIHLGRTERETIGEGTPRDLSLEEGEIIRTHGMYDSLLQRGEADVEKAAATQRLFPGSAPSIPPPLLDSASPSISHVQIG